MKQIRFRLGLVCLIIALAGSGGLLASFSTWEGNWVLEWWEQFGDLYDARLVEFKLCVPDYFNPCDYDYKVKSFYDGRWRVAGTGDITDIGDGDYRFDFNLWENEFTFIYSSIHSFMKGGGMVSQKPEIWCGCIPVKASLSKY